MSNQFKQFSWRHKFRTPLKVRRQRRLKSKAIMHKNHDHVSNANNDTWTINYSGNKPRILEIMELESIRKSLNHSSFDEPDVYNEDSKTKNHFQNSKTKKSFIKPIVKTVHQTANTSMILESKIKEHSQQKNPKYIPITNGIMKSLVVALSYIEQYDGFTVKELYVISSTKFINTTKVVVTNETYHQYQPYVNQCIDVILQGNVTQVEQLDSIIMSFSSHFNTSFDADKSSSCSSSSHKCNIIALAIKGVIKHCEPLIPSSMFSKVMSIGHGSDIEQLLSSMEWSNLTSMTLILFLHHLAKLFHIRKDDVWYIKEVAKEIGNLLLNPLESKNKNDHDNMNIPIRRKTNNIKKSSFSFIKQLLHKQDRRKAAAAAAALDMSTNMNMKTTNKTYNVYDKERIIMMILSHIMNDDSITITTEDKNYSITHHEQMRLSTSNSIAISKNLKAKECDNDDNNNNNVDNKDGSINNHVPDVSELVAPQYEANPNNPNGIHNSANCSTTAAATTSSRMNYNHGDNDIIMILNKAKKRIQSAEMVLKQIDHCLSIN